MKHILMVVCALAALRTPASLMAQSANALPFAIGERLNYVVHRGAGGPAGKGSMWIEGPIDVRGTATMLLHSDFQAHLGWFSATDRSDSWVDPLRMADLRFDKTEKRFLSSSTERVEIYPDEQKWTSDAGKSGASVTSAPLDELSFIYYLRTLDLTPDSSYSVDRHYDAARNPVKIKVLGRDTVKTEAGEFATVVVEMRVKDAENYKSEGVITFYFTDDAAHIPVRIESVAPVFGKAVFTLESFTPGAGRPAIAKR